MNADLTAEDRLKRIDTLQAQEPDSRRKTVRQAWMSVGIAALVLIALAVGAGLYVNKARHDLAVIESQRATETQELKRVKQERANEEAALAQTRDALAKAQNELTDTRAQNAAVLARIPPQQRQEALNQQIDADPKAARLLPRAYVQIVEEADRPWAKQVSVILERAGIIVPGIENVPRDVDKLKDTQVRYYKKAEEPGADNLVALLRSAGVEARAVHLTKEENNRKVRPFHYEIWFVAGSRNTPLK